MALTSHPFSNAVSGPAVKVGFVAPARLIQLAPPLTEACHWMVGVVMSADAVKVSDPP